MSDASTNKTEREEKERKALFRLEKGIVKLAQSEPRKSQSAAAEQKVADMMEWFVKLDGPSQ